MPINFNIRQYLGAILKAFLADALVDSVENTRLQHYTLFLSIAIPTMVLYGLANFFRGNKLLCLLILCSGAGLLLGLLALRKMKNRHIVYRTNIVLYGALVIYMMVLGGEAGSKILWVYTFPLIAFFLFGKGEGMFWSAILLLAILLSFWGPLQSLVLYPYVLQFKTRFITTYLIVSTVTYWFEYSRYHYQLGTEEKNRTLEKEKNRLNLEINKRQQLENELRRLASTDPLTGAANRRHFMEIANKELERFRRYHHPMAVAIMDIDHFKNVNDTYGHPAGDEVLKAVVQYCHSSLRKTDLMGRIGGEEFGFLLIETTLMDANLFADRLRREIAELRVASEDGSLEFTVSIGVTSVQSEDNSLTSIIKRADEALYQAKTMGRNRTATL